MHNLKLHELKKKQIDIHNIVIKPVVRCRYNFLLMKNTTEIKKIYHFMSSKFLLIK